MGPCKQPGGKVFPGSQVVEGRDLLSGSMRDTSKEIGVIGRKKESKGGKAAVLEKYGYSEEGLRPQENQLGTPGNKLRQGMRQREDPGKEAVRMEDPEEEGKEGVQRW